MKLQPPVKFGIRNELRECSIVPDFILLCFVRFRGIRKGFWEGPAKRSLLPKVEYSVRKELNELRSLSASSSLQIFTKVSRLKWGPRILQNKREYNAYNSGLNTQSLFRRHNSVGGGLLKHLCKYTSRKEREYKTYKLLQNTVK